VNGERAGRPEPAIAIDEARVATLFLCGDVMTGRGVDHILPHPGRPELIEAYVKDAAEYVALAEGANGPVPRPTREAYIWGDALAELAHAQPRVRIANLETSITACDEYWPGKGIHYRMHPANIGCLTAARLDVCSLANNHVLDFGLAGLHETLETLASAGIRTAGAGRDLAAARRPAVVPLLPGSRLLVFAFGTPSSGVFHAWAARPDRAGLDVVTDLSEAAADALGTRLAREKRSRDVAIASIHWGDNWGYDVAAIQQRFARALIDRGFDVIHGHSSHHPRPIEIYRRRLILYGCGDFINDYEGIPGYEPYRDDLVLMYFATIAADSGELGALRMIPMQIRQLRLARPSRRDARWMRDTLARISAPFRTAIDLEDSGALVLRSNAGSAAK
jgi:poly-gamma-glutamate synthesis protein (capsule biosynthesis protein)